MSYYGEWDSPSYAAGCMSIQQGAFFNKIVDPALTFPKRLLYSGGVCLNRGTCLHISRFVPFEKIYNFSPLCEYANFLLYFQLLLAAGQGGKTGEIAPHCAELGIKYEAVTVLILF